MRSRLRRGRNHVAIAWLFRAASAGALLALCSATAPLGLLAEREAHAQSDAELKAARKLFAEAVKDQDERRFEAALEKFRNVQQVKDTQPVRYRIATCLEELGKPREALRAFDAALDPSAPGQADDVTRAAQAHRDAVAKRVARITLTLSPHAPTDADVRIDDERVPASALGTAIPIDPGAHQVTATGKDAPPFHTSLSLTEGGQASVMVTLEPAAARASESETPLLADPHAAAASGAHARRTWGLVGLVGGGIFVAGGVVTLLLRHGDIAELNRSCPAGVCPADRQAELSSVHSRALVEGPIGYGLIGVGLVGAGIGAYLLATPSDVRASTRVAPFFVREGGGMSVSRSF